MGGGDGPISPNLVPGHISKIPVPGLGWVIGAWMAPSEGRGLDFSRGLDVGPTVRGAVWFRWGFERVTTSGARAGTLVRDSRMGSRAPFPSAGILPVVCWCVGITASSYGGSMSERGRLTVRMVGQEELRGINSLKGHKGARAYRPVDRAAADMAKLKIWRGPRYKSWAEHPDDRVRSRFVHRGRERSEFTFGQLDNLCRAELAEARARNVIATPVMFSLLPYARYRLSFKRGYWVAREEKAFRPRKLAGAAGRMYADVRAGDVDDGPSGGVFKALAEWGEAATDEEVVAMLPFLGVRDLCDLLPLLGSVSEELLWVAALTSPGRLAGFWDGGGPLQLAPAVYSGVHEILVSELERILPDESAGSSFQVPDDVRERVAAWLDRHSVAGDLGRYLKDSCTRYVPGHSSDAGFEALYHAFDPLAFQSLWRFSSQPLPDEIGRRALDVVRQASRRASRSGSHLPKTLRVAWPVLFASSRGVIEDFLEMVREHGSPTGDDSLSRFIGMLPEGTALLDELRHHPRLPDTFWRRHLNLLQYGHQRVWASALATMDEGAPMTSQEAADVLQCVRGQIVSPHWPMGVIGALLEGAGRGSGGPMKAVCSQVIRDVVPLAVRDDEERRDRDERYGEGGWEEYTSSSWLAIKVSAAGAPLDAQAQVALVEAACEFGSPKAHRALSSLVGLEAEAARALLQGSRSHTARETIVQNDRLRGDPGVRNILLRSRHTTVVRRLLADGCPAELDALFRVAIEKGEQEAMAIVLDLDADALAGLNPESLLPYLESEDTELRTRAFELLGHARLI